MSRWVRVNLARLLPRAATSLVGRFVRVLMRLVPAGLRKRRAFILAPLGLLAVVGLMRMRGGEPVAPPEPYESVTSSSLVIDAPTERTAGEPYEVVVRGPMADGDIAELLIETSFAHERHETEVVGDTATFVIDETERPTTGTVTLTAISGTQTGRTTIEILPGPAVDPLELFLGPRTIEATNDTATMIVVVPQDEFGNPVADGTEVGVRVTRPDQRAQEFELRTDGLVAWSRIISGTLAGRSKVAVTVAEARGKELDFLEVAGSPLPFRVQAVDPATPADGRSLIRVRTDQLADEFGNVLPDGVAVFADVEGPGGIRRLQAQVIKGVAEFTLEAPSRPGTESVVVHASGTLSEPLLVSFGPMVTGFDVAAATDIDGVRISVGPIISTLGAYIPDGTVVTVATENDVRQYPTFNGEADVVIPATTEPITVEVLGFERTVQVSR